MTWKCDLCGSEDLVVGVPAHHNPITRWYWKKRRFKVILLCRKHYGAIEKKWAIVSLSGKERKNV